ncbi:hypothetical protein ABT340_35630 [Streptosporangium sp. NPDC000239]|uniref:hypothetical protein n=1 Tax=Streptosporangium sp. NPDC000239 TaxID=3154248 RepID=UPI0033201649
MTEEIPARRPPTSAQLYADAVWDADPNDLAQAELAMALCYANHAHKAPYDRAWVTNERLMQQCKIRSTSTVGRVRDSLVEKGWLIPLDPKTFMPLTEAERRDFQRKRKTIPYRLAIPPASSMVEAACSITEEATTSTDEVADPPTTSLIETTTSMSESHYFDDRYLPSYYPLQDPLSSLSAPERKIMKAVTATIEETREIISLMEDEALKKGNPIGNLERYVDTVAANDHLPSWLARVRAVRRAAAPTPTPPPYAEVHARQADTRASGASRDEELTDREKAIAHARGRVGHSAPKARLAIPEQAEPAEVAEARAELAQSGDFDRWLDAAAHRLGKDAPPNEVVILAATLRRTATAALAGGAP